MDQEAAIGKVMLPEPAIRRGRPLKVRNGVRGYLSSGFVFGLVGGFLVYLGFAAGGLVTVAVAWLVLLAVFVQDFVVFDGKRFRRTGFQYRLCDLVTANRSSLRPKDIEKVETRAFRTFRYRGRIHYHYRTSFQGRGAAFNVTSSSGDYIDLLRAVLERLPPEIADQRTIDIRDNLTSVETVAERASRAEIPASDVLEDMFPPGKPGRHILGIRSAQNSSASPAKAAEYRKLANELRVAGLLAQAIEAFRRALAFDSSDPWLTYDTARCLQSVAGAAKDPAMARRADAMLRLCERRGSSDPWLLTRLAENRLRRGDSSRAEKLFTRALSGGDHRFASLRGLGEAALQQGKIAHAILNFALAEKEASTVASRRWARRELDYFSRLNDDGDFLELELGRVNFLNSVISLTRSGLRLCLFGVLVAVLGVCVSEFQIANVGWAVAGIAGVLWLTGGILQSLLSQRLPVKSFENES